jgi:Phage tail sheath protein subtilisin-like domain/Phage tail sheath C-terminal domain
MALSIQSPGVQIIETDLSQNITIPGGTYVYVPGFAPQGPTDEVLQISSISEFENIYGAPTTAAERYFYYSSQAVINSNGNLLTTRLPYGSGAGAGFSNLYSALFFPVVSSGNSFSIGAPNHVTLGEDAYQSLIQNNFSWGGLSNTASTSFTAGGNLSAGIIIINSAQIANDEFNQGYYINLADNTNWGPNTPYNSVTNIYSLSSQDGFVPISTSNLGFALSSAAGVTTDSISQVIESIPAQGFGSSYYNDTLVLTLFKVRNSTYQPNILTYSLAESYVGSLNPNKKGTANSGNQSGSFYLKDLVNNKSNNIQMLINPLISTLTNWVALTGTAPAYSVRNLSATALYADGVFNPTYTYETSNTIGSLDQKLSRALTLVSAPETQVIDVVVDAGLSTIFANTSANQTYKDNVYADVASLSSYSTSTTLQNWNTIFNIFNTFCQSTRKDCVFIADPLRQIFVNGTSTKTLDVRTNNFTQNIYTPLYQSLVGVDTNYSVLYANWLKVYDTFSGNYVWVPNSGFVAGIYANSDAATQPWIAPAGLNRGILNNVTDIAFNPNQKQRDYLYQISTNPICLFSGEGYTVYGQKTLQSKPSAFDRVNVRRLFLTLERAVSQAVKYFVFEPNTDFTQTRLVNTITPIFELAKNTQGLYDYLIVCDSRNNPPAVVDNNQLNVDIYIKPVRAAEFILVNFIATTTGQNFSELI